ncbi:MAG: DUF2807 domain-containing protein [Cytophagales bacterium]|nr:DUF2807 domain-containing protein [Cytophagales bacterium]
MKKIVIIAIVLFTGLTAQAQKEETRNLSSFSEISAQEGIDVFIKSGSKEEARIEASGLDMDEVLTEVSNGKLKIHLEGNNHRNTNVSVWVTYKSIKAVSVSSAASLRGEDDVNASGDFRIKVSSAGDLELTLKAGDLDIEVSSAGDANLNVDVSTIDASVSSAGDVEIEGSANTQDINVSSSGDYDGYDVESEEAEVSASSGGSARVNVSEQLNARASSGGSIRYKGNPRMDVSSSSGGSIRKY